ncbi:hypothetical protein [Streptomyces sp. NPDC088727]|uniref:hypothetical protein n=1 Tax=Streptomyces sp. NPDC088727 TaxID=3365875 RepID=UPI00380F64EA
MPLANEDIAILEYVHDTADRDLAKPVDIWSIFARDEWGAAARRLHQAGLIEIASLADDYHITALGLSVIAEIRMKRNHGPARIAALHLALLQWLYDLYLEDAYPASTEDFRASNRSYYMGRPFGSREIRRAISHLLAVKLIQGTQDEETDRILRPSLTPRGLDCTESEKSVSEFLNPVPDHGPTFNVRINGSQNVTVGTQSNFTQNNTSGIDPEALAQVTHFATVARQGIPTYAMDEDQQVAVEQVAQELEAEATSDAPDRGRLSRLTDRLVAAIAPAAGSALGGMVMALGEQAATAIAG